MAQIVKASKKSSKAKAVASTANSAPIRIPKEIPYEFRKIMKPQDKLVVEYTFNSFNMFIESTVGGKTHRTAINDARTAVLAEKDLKQKELQKLRLRTGLERINPSHKRKKDLLQIYLKSDTVQDFWNSLKGNFEESYIKQLSVFIKLNRHQFQTAGQAILEDPEGWTRRVPNRDHIEPIREFLFSEKPHRNEASPRSTPEKVSAKPSGPKALTSSH